MRVSRIAVYGLFAADTVKKGLPTSLEQFSGESFPALYDLPLGCAPAANSGACKSTGNFINRVAKTQHAENFFVFNTL